MKALAATVPVSIIAHHRPIHNLIPRPQRLERERGDIRLFAVGDASGLTGAADRERIGKIFVIGKIGSSSPIGRSDLIDDKPLRGLMRRFPPSQRGACVNNTVNVGTLRDSPTDSARGSVVAVPAANG